MSVRNLDRLFKPASIALIGATDRTGSVGAVVLRNLRRAGFSGELMLVSPRHRVIDGMAVYADVASLPHIAELAVIATPPDTVPGLVAELGASGTKAAIVITAGFGELGEEGKALQEATLQAARPHLLRLVGPNCVGVMVPGIGLDASFSHLAPAAGHLAFVSQSGAMITAMLDWAAPRGLGFSHVVSLGDMADVDFGDTLDYLAADAKTQAILLYVEGITHGRKFMSAARAAARAKPVLVLKAGHSAAGAKAAHSHTGVLAGSDAVYDAAFARAGMLRVGTMAELFEAALTLALTRRQKGERLVIVSNGGGAGVLATDALAAQGGKLAQLAPETIAGLDKVLPATWSHGNPVDIIGDAPGARYAAALDKVLDDGGVDAVLVLNCPTALAGADEGAQAVIDMLGNHAATSQRNVFTAWLGEQTAASARALFGVAGIPSYETPEAAVAGFLHRVRYQHSQALLVETPPARSGALALDVTAVNPIIAKAMSTGQSWLDAESVATVLSAYGIPQPPSRNVTDAEQAAEAASQMGFPVALKIRSPDIIHKSDLGGVALGLGNRAAVRDAARAMLDRARLARPEARIDGVLVQQMIERPGAVELLAGLNDDAVFGPVVVFGQGGTAVEIIRDSAVALPPLNPLLARSQMERTRVWLLLQAYRGKPAAAVDAIAEVLIRLGELAANHPEVKELDINPLLADASGVVALDTRIRIAPAATAGTSRFAIAPYPKHLETVGAARDGASIALRPVRPEDAPLLQDLFAHMSPEDQRLRFFAPMRELSHALAARLSQIDYDREMALIAQYNGVPLGVARYAADPDRLRAEYAVAVRSDWKGRGVGYLLMMRLITVAREAGIGELFGDVLHENQLMIDMCRELGFSATVHPGDPTLITVRKPLGTE
jgi:acetyltransferase